MRITLSGDDQRNVDKAMDIILGVAKNTQTIVRGPVPVPPHPGERARRVLDVVERNHKFIPELTSTDLSATVTVTIRG